MKLCWEEGIRAAKSTFDGMPHMKALKKRTRRGVRVPKLSPAIEPG